MPDGPKVVRITGRDRVLAQLTKDVAGIKIRTKTAMRLAAMVVQRTSMDLTPVDQGNLVNSCGVDVFKEKGNIVGEIYYTADYAPYVHEINATHSPPTQWKFLETAMKRNHKKVVDMLTTFQKAGF